MGPLLNPSRVFTPPNQNILPRTESQVSTYMPMHRGLPRGMRWAQPPTLHACSHVHGHDTCSHVHGHVYAHDCAQRNAHRGMHTDMRSDQCTVALVCAHSILLLLFPLLTHPSLDARSSVVLPETIPLFRNSWHLTPALLPNMTLPTTEDPSVCIGSLRCWAFLFTCQARLPSPTEVEALLWELQGLLHSKHLVSCRDSQP